MKMDINNNDYYLLKISEFLDGELSPEETRELFNYIADNPELQEELKSSMAVRNMFHQELIPPPPQSKVLLYSKLNLQKTAVVLGFLITTLTQLRKILFNPTVGATLLGIGMFLMGYYASQLSFDRNQNSSFNATSSQIEKNNAADNIPIVSSSEKISPVQTSKANNSNPTVPNKSKPKTMQSLPQIKTAQANNNLYEANSEIIDYKAPIQNELLLSKSKSSNYDLNNNKINFELLPEVEYILSSFLDKMSISITKSNNTSTIKNNLEPLSNPMLNDYSVAIGFNIDKNNSISFEFGQENYPQRYTGVINNRNATINQIYTAQWYGLSYQHTFDSFSDKLLISPFTKVLASTTKVGPLLKGSAGLSYNVNEKLILQLGFEASSLYYQFQGNTFNTLKYGIFYGAKLNF